jgi:hypothetical protein
MAIIDETKKEMAAYEKGPFENLAVQDALIIIAVYAAQMDPQDCESDVERIEAIAESRPEFVEKKAEIFARINTYVNAMRAMDPQQAVEIAADVLNAELKNRAFDFAAEVALPDNVLTDEKQALLDNLAAALSIDREFARQTTAKYQIV